MGKGEATRAPTATTPLYEHAGFFLVRAPALPADTFRQLTADSPDGAGGAAARDMAGGAVERLERLRSGGLARLRRLAADPLVEVALYAASPDLTGAVARLGTANRPDGAPDGGDAEPLTKRSARAYSRLLRYLTRMSTRPTPFGLFAGVGLGTFGETTSLRLGTPALAGARTRADMAWVFTVIHELDQQGDLLPHRRMVWNPTVYLAGGRAILPYADLYGEADRRQVTVMATEVVELVRKLAATTTQFDDIVAELCSAFPWAERERAAAAVRGLWEQHLLVGEPRPSLAEPRPERYLLELLQTMPPAGQAPVAGQRKLIEAVVELTDAVNHPPRMPTVPRLRELTALQRELAPEHRGPTYQVDAALRLEATGLSAAVGAAVADAAECLLRLSCHLPRIRHLADYHAAFVERYGEHAEVPLLELLSPELGLDAPPTYGQPARAWPLPTAARSDRSPNEQAMAALVAEALCQQQHEIELTDQRLAELAVWSPAPDHPPAPPTLDVYLQVQAPSRAAIDRGEWRGVLARTELGSGVRTFGRFLDLLGEDGTARLRALARREEALVPDAVVADLSYVPPHGRGANVAIHPRLRDYEVPVHVAPAVGPAGVVTLDDILVGATPGRFYLRSQRLNRRIRVTQSHQLNYVGAPNVCRFLLEASADGYALPLGVDWSPLATAPFLPRLTRGNIVLRPSQWHLLPATVLGSAARTARPSRQEEAEFFEAVRAWRRQWRVPRHVYLVEHDNRLLLDLEHPLWLAELRTELVRLAARHPAAGLTLQEMHPGMDDLWLTDTGGHAYVCELVVPLVRTGAVPAPVPGKLPEPAPPRPVLRARDRRHLPGGAWTYVKLYCADRQQDQVIAGPLRELVSECLGSGAADRWFYLRYHDPRPHLRLRVRAAKGVRTEDLLDRVLVWSHDLVDRDLAIDVTLDTYHQEVERYGGPAAMDPAERIFQASSGMAADLVAALDDHRIDLEPEVAAVFALDRLFAHWGLGLPDRLAHVPEADEAPEAREAFRERRRLLCELIHPWDAHPEPAARAHRALLLEICEPYLPVVAEAGARMRNLAAGGELWTSTAHILSSLAHMHVNRLLGADMEQEQRCYLWWRKALHAIAHRPQPLDTRIHEATAEHRMQP